MGIKPTILAYQDDALTSLSYPARGHITFITVYSYRCSTLLLVIIVNLLLYHRYGRKKYSIYRASYSSGFRPHWGSQNIHPILWMWGDYCLLNWQRLLSQCPKVETRETTVLLMDSSPSRLKNQDRSNNGYT